MSILLQKETDKLKKMLLSLCTMVEESLLDVMRSVIERDTYRATRVIQRDVNIDSMEIEVEEECLKILALHQPIASDLRFIIAVLKINNDLERIGDLAVNIAERVEILSKAQNGLLFDFANMFEKAVLMLKKSIDSLVQLDTKLAIQVCASDDEIDALNREVFALCMSESQKDPAKIETLLQYLSISRNLERIADHTTNIAEDVVYLIEGRIIRHHN